MGCTKRLVQLGYTFMVFAIAYALTMPVSTEAQPSFRPAGPIPSYVGGAAYISGSGYINGAYFIPNRYRNVGEAWANLDTPDPDKGRQAIAALVENERESVNLLQGHLRPVKPAERKQLDQLIADLDDDRFDIRDRALQRLAEFGEAARPGLRRALANEPSLETKWRAEDLLRQLDQSASGNRLRSQRAMEVLGTIGSAEARALLSKLAGGAPEAHQTQDARAALERCLKYFRTPDAFPMLTTGATQRGPVWFDLRYHGEPKE